MAQIFDAMGQPVFITQAQLQFINGLTRYCHSHKHPNNTIRLYLLDHTCTGLHGLLLLTDCYFTQTEKTNWEHVAKTYDFCLKFVPKNHF